jgi:hypothetical protein
MADVYTDNEQILNQFNRLLNELLKGTLSRNSFLPWEVTLLLDIDASDPNMPGRRDLLKRYQKAVQRQMERGAAMPMLFSEYVSSLPSNRKIAAGEPEDSSVNASKVPLELLG